MTTVMTIRLFAGSLAHWRLPNFQNSSTGGNNRIQAPWL